MEPGKLLFAEGHPGRIILISLGVQEESVALIRRLLNDASASYPQLAQLQLVDVPLPVFALPEQTAWLSAMLVGQWRDLPAVEDSVDAIISAIGLTDIESGSLLSGLDATTTDTVFTFELVVRIQAIRERQHKLKLSPARLPEWLEQQATELAAWFALPSDTSSDSSAGGCLAQLQVNFLALRSKLLDQLEDHFTRWRYSGSRPLLQWLALLDEALEQIRADYESRRQDCLRCEGSAWRAYYKLSVPDGERVWGLPDRRRLDWEAAVRALAAVYDFKIKVQLYTLAAQIVGELIQRTRLYTTSLTQTDLKLAELQVWFTERCPDEPLFAPLLTNYMTRRLDASRLRSELEDWADCKLERWSAMDGVQTEALCRQMLLRMQPLCLELYAECCHSLLDPLQAVSPAARGRVSLAVHETDIREALSLLAQVSGVRIVAAQSISGTVSLKIDDLPFAEALEALMAAGNLTCTQSGDTYVLSQPEVRG